MKPLLLALFALLAQPGRAQSKFVTNAGRVDFTASGLLEDIEAHNQAAAAVLDLGTGQLAFAVPISKFVFKRTLMQEHFNENYLESDKYPKATFAGRFVGAGTEAATLAAAGPHPVRVEGELTIHGVMHRVAVPGTLELKNGQLLVAATFQVAPADYKIEIPLLVRDKIAKIVRISVALAGEPTGSAAPLSRANPDR